MAIRVQYIIVESILKLEGTGKKIHYHDEW